MSNKELISISYSMDCGAEYESYYEFAVNYLSNTAIDGSEKAGRFFELIKTVMDRPDDRMIQSALGKRSSRTDASAPSIKTWCRAVLGNGDLRELAPDELQYVMGYCARRAKIASSGL